MIYSYCERINKMRLGIVVCDFCGNLVETELYVMRDCPLVMSLRLNVNVDARGPFLNMDMHHWLMLILREEIGWNLNVAWKDLWAQACHSIWYWRNKEKHDDSFERPINPAQHVMINTRNYEVVDSIVVAETISSKTMWTS
ncbi:hypothetical protein TSUD_134470 [Trifolium subterraneum]|uniref:Reverse transcriptase zinc-binding domain-containing protein n=1 Tax=Trifolium subterraneum TaxID=3900 RepID=A0A2Z6PLZ8_TRISU|nr:hypothetical protein TSUD_134470 [Trifolium subterraneum]